MVLGPSLFGRSIRTTDEFCGKLGATLVKRHRESLAKNRKVYPIGISTA